jgi:hypothetical protein
MHSRSGSTEKVTIEKGEQEYAKETSLQTSIVRELQDLRDGLLTPEERYVQSGQGEGLDPEEQEGSGCPDDLQALSGASLRKGVSR